MDRASHSPVLLQHASPPHTLTPHSNLQNLPASFEPRLDPPHIALAQTQQTPSPEEQLRSSVMEEQLAHNDPVNIELSREAAPVDLNLATTQSTENQISRAESQPLMAMADIALQASINTAQPPEPSAELSQQIPEISESQIDATVVETESNSPTTDPDPPPPPPPAVEVRKLDVPEWVTYEDDTSDITEDELKRIEGTDADVSALDVLHYEKKIYTDVDDPEQRPVKKLRLSWTIKGVRGTKERPNYARVMNSPAVRVDGHYWYIKFFPRGNSSSQLSVYIRCTPEPPQPDADVPENTFRVFKGLPDANLGETEPIVNLSSPPNKGEAEPTLKVQDAEADSKGAIGEAHPKTTIASADDSTETGETAVTQEPETDWRISAQLGAVIYNPAEPRTSYHMSSEHQFNKHNDDWGWTNFDVPWTTMHIRGKDQRKPLLQNDTLTIDAYIQIYEDPTQALWWHQAQETETQWDSKSLAGYFAFGTPPLYHSPGVAGLSALLLLKPFRDVLQRIDTGRWRKHPSIRPQPLISQLQIVLFLMRSMKKEEQYVNVNPVLETLATFSETFSTVRQFWEVLRRSIELELEDNVEARKQLADIFDGADASQVSPVTLGNSLKIPVEGIEDIQAGIEKSLVSSDGIRSFPKFLTIDLDRQKFDTSTREWKVLHDRVKINEEINLSTFSAEETPSEYTLYGFAVHVGERVSGRAYSVLRPKGPGTKWLAFEDGDGNKVFSYTKKRIQDYEGLDSEALSSFRSTRQTAYIAMYIRTDCLKDFLPRSLEAYDEPSFDWIRAHLAHAGIAFLGDTKPKRPDSNESTKKNISVEVYDAAKVKGRKGLLDMYNLRDRTQQFQKLSLPGTTTFKKLRHIIAESMWIENVETIRFWAMEYGPLGEFMMATMPRPKLEYMLAGRKNRDYKPLCLWVEVLKTEEEVKLYGIADPPEAEKPKVDQMGLFGDMVGASGERPDDSHGALNLLFPEHQEGSPEGTPTGTVTTPSSSGTDDHVAVADQVQESVAGAVSATIGTVPDFPVDAGGTFTLDINIPTNRDALENFDFDSFLHPIGTDDLNIDFTFARLGHGEESGPAGDTTPRALPVEHGHLVDAMNTPPQQMSSDSVTIPEQGTTTSSGTDNNSATVATIIGANLGVASTIQERALATTEAGLPVEPQAPSEPTADIWQVPGESQSDPVDHSIHIASSSLTTPPIHEAAPPRSQPRPITHIYGFIQLFDVEQQEFVIHTTFFASYTADVKDTVRKAMGYGDDHEICVWQRERSSNTSSVNNGTTFEAIHFRDGVDLVVSEPLPEKMRSQLLSEGKFVTPDSLSYFLWMKQRRHPVESFTGTKTLNTFGGIYYSGPLLHGRFHGDDGTYITSAGHTYTGPFVSGVRQGAQATLTYQNGDIYTGGFHADEKHGQGTFIQKRTGNKYVGGYQNDKRWGRGTMYYEVADEEGEMCQICYGEEMDALFYDCGHVCACVECARQVEICPICRKSVREVVKVYRA